jgi:lysozyme
MTISERGISLIKSFEAYIPTLYLDAVNVVTIGYGHVVTHKGKQLKGTSGLAIAKELFNRPISIQEADILLRKDLLSHVDTVFQLTKTIPDIKQSMFDALVSFEYNTGSLSQSTLLKKLKTRDILGAAAEFEKWNKGTVNGKKIVLKGLTRRRLAEKDLFLSGLKLL